MTIYTVQKGDSLYSIGKKYGVTIEQLLNANGSTVEPTLIVGQAVIIPTANENRKQKLINGYLYPNITRDALLTSLPYFSNIAPFSYGVTADGGLLPIEDSDIITISESAGVTPFLVVTSLNEEGVFNSQRASDVLTDKSLSETLIQNILKQLESRDYFGVDIDFEYIPPAEKSAYAEFIDKLRQTVSQYGYKTAVSLAPKTSNTQRGLLYEAHDYALLGEAADYTFIMAYEWGYTYGPPMAIAPIDKVREVVEYALTEIPNDKIVLGIPNYAYDWTRPYVQGQKAESMSNIEAVNRARRVGAEILFDSQAMTPYYTYFKDNTDHIVWFEDARSVRARMELINEFDLAGLSVWNITSAYKPLLTTVNSYFFR